VRCLLIAMSRVPRPNTSPMLDESDVLTWYQRGCHGSRSGSRLRLSRHGRHRRADADVV